MNEVRLNIEGICVQNSNCFMTPWSESFGYFWKKLLSYVSLYKKSDESLEYCNGWLNNHGVE